MAQTRRYDHLECSHRQLSLPISMARSDASCLAGALNSTLSKLNLGYAMMAVTVCWWTPSMRVLPLPPVLWRSPRVPVICGISPFDIDAWVLPPILMTNIPLLCSMAGASGSWRIQLAAVVPVLLPLLHSGCSLCRPLLGWILPCDLVPCFWSPLVAAQVHPWRH